MSTSRKKHYIGPDTLTARDDSYIFTEKVLCIKDFQKGESRRASVVESVDYF